MTNDLLKRAGEHKEKNIEGFSCKYNCIELVYFEIFTKPIEAIQREKQIKAGSRNKKIELIEQKNPKWRDLYYDLL
jgi:putative endonuclease